MNEEPLIWETYAHERKQNSSNWYWVVGIITIALIVVCILLDNTMFGIVIGLSVVILTYYARKEPEVIEVELGNRGIRVDKKIYLFEHLHSFHIEKEGPPKLILKSKKMWMPLVTIRLGDADPEIIEAHMFEYLAEDFHPEPLTHKLLDYLGF